MPLNFASTLLATAIVASILPPGYFAYIGAYVALAASLLALLVFGWRQRSIFSHPSSLAIVAAILLVAVPVPFVYRSEQDILAPILIMPMLATIAIGLLSHPARWAPSPEDFARICLSASLIALVGGIYEQHILGVYRPGLGNNPIHYGSLAAMAGCLALVGVAAGQSPWRYFYFLGPIFSLGAVSISGSRGPLAGVVAMTAVGTLVLVIWLWRDTLFRFVLIAGLAAGTVGFAISISIGTARVAGILASATDIFYITGGPDDIRAALYASAVDILRTSPFVGVGLGQIMDHAESMFPGLVIGRDLDNLHADWANFAAMGGGLGLIAWILLLAAPLLLLLVPSARQDRPILLGSLLLVTGQFVLGVSNATFGVLPQTAIYAVVLGYFIARARNLPERVPNTRIHPPSA